jgi:hypothetical protein
VHTDLFAAALARTLDADALTVGRDIFLNSAQYTPETTAGRRLLAHELAHVVQQSGAPIAGSAQLVDPDSNLEREAEHAADMANTVHVARSTAPLSVQRQKTSIRSATLRESRDYTNAQQYVTDFYSTQARIHDDLGEATHRAINKFTEISSIPVTALRANIVYQLVRVALGVLPGASGVIELFDRLSAGLQLATNGARLATIAGVVSQRGAAGIYGAAIAPRGGERQMAAVSALDSLSRFDTEGAQAIERERAEIRSLVEKIGADPTLHSTVYQEVVNGLGRLPVYDASVIQQFEKEYELRLYQNYYVEHGWINHKPPSLIGSPYTSYSIVDVPPSSQRRILELYRQLGHVAQVSIDTRFSSADPDYAEVVNILLDWGVKLYWLRGYVSDKPEELHTGSDLRQPYRGPRFREVK